MNITEKDISVGKNRFIILTTDVAGGGKAGHTKHYHNCFVNIATFKEKRYSGKSFTPGAAPVFIGLETASCVYSIYFKQIFKTKYSMHIPVFRISKHDKFS